MNPLTITGKIGPRWGRQDYTLQDLDGHLWRVQQKEDGGEFFLSKNGKELARFGRQRDAFEHLWTMCAKPDLHTQLKGYRVGTTNPPTRS